MCCKLQNGVKNQSGIHPCHIGPYNISAISFLSTEQALLGPLSALGKLYPLPPQSDAPVNSQFTGELTDFFFLYITHTTRNND